MYKIKVLFDGECPFCSREIAWLKRRDKNGVLAFEDIAAADFNPEKYGLTSAAVSAEIHGILPDGRIVKRVEVFRQIYSALGLGWLVKPTAWPVLREIFDLLYLLFARNRVRLGRLFGGRSCKTDRCGPNQCKTE